MAGKRKRKKRFSPEYRDADLNIMPFIDVFSVLNTFLLFSAVFVALGSVRVQVPFFTNKEPEDNRPTRNLSVKVDLRKEEIILTSSYSMAPVNERTVNYPTGEEGLKRLHTDLVELRTSEPKTDLVTLFVDDDVAYNDVILTLDAIKLRFPGDPEIESSTEDASGVSVFSKDYLYPKVVMGSILL
jgi:biopolymer transport protein ExbD